MQQDSVGITSRYPGFPGGEPALHVRTVPACVALGMTEIVADDGRVGGSLSMALPANRDRNGLPSRGAALVLADQAAAVGTFATLPAPSAMMTLDLRLDWHGAMPPAEQLTVLIDDAVRQGELSVVRGRLFADSALAATLHATFLIGALPGGRIGKSMDDLLPDVQSAAAAFDDLLRLEADGDGWLIRPDTEMVGARAVPAYHGGFVAAALDHVSTSLAGAHAPVNFDIRYLLPARSDLPLRLRARVLRSGKRASVIEAEAVQGEKNAVVAATRATFLSAPGPEQSVHRFTGG